MEFIQYRKARIFQAVISRSSGDQSQQDPSCMPRSAGCRLSRIPPSYYSSPLPLLSFITKLYLTRHNNMYFITIFLKVIVLLQPLTVAASLNSSIKSYEAFASREYFYVGGDYVQTSAGHIFENQMYVEKLTPQQPCQSYPLVFIHGQGQTGTVCKAFSFQVQAVILISAINVC
jgi:hypothetical protein